MEKFWNIRITGKVQDTGFRSLIEDIARLYDLRGFTFNDTDNSVKMVCSGENGLIEDFLEEIRDKGALKGAVIEDITSEEIPFKIYLPPKFLRLYTDELSDISRKLDIGIDILLRINEGTKALPDIKTGIDALNTKFDSLNTKFDSLNTKFDSFITEQKENNQWMKGHNQRLEKILEKLAEK